MTIMDNNDLNDYSHFSTWLLQKKKKKNQLKTHTLYTACQLHMANTTAKNMASFWSGLGHKSDFNG